MEWAIGYLVAAFICAGIFYKYIICDDDF